MDVVGKRHAKMGAKGRVETGAATRIILYLCIMVEGCEARRCVRIHVTTSLLCLISMRMKLRLTGVGNWPLNWQFRAEAE